MDTERSKEATKGWGGDCCCLIAKSCLTLFATLWTIACLPGSSVHGIAQARILEWVAIPPPGDLPDPGIEPASSCIGKWILYTEPPGKRRGGGG